MGDPSIQADVGVRLRDEDLLGLHVLATLDGVGRDDAAGFAEITATTLRRGIRARFDAAGLAWPPGPQALERAATLTAEPAGHDGGAAGRPGITGGRLGLAGGRLGLATPAGRRGAATLGLLAAIVVVLVGGYALRWSWTGLPGNDQVWDWLHLLVLPVALATFPLWLSYAGYMSTTRRRALGACALAFLVFVLVGYVAPLVWTGFRGQTLWNWLTLLLLPLALVSVQRWPTSGREFRRHHAALITVLLLAWGVTLVGGYAGDWTWTGYAGNTLWDWVSLLLGPLAITTIVVPQLARRISGHAVARAEAEADRRARERVMAEARARRLT